MAKFNNGLMFFDSYRRTNKVPYAYFQKWNTRKKCMREALLDFTLHNDSLIIGICGRAPLYKNMNLYFSMHFVK